MYDKVIQNIDLIKILVDEKCVHVVEDLLDVGLEAHVDHPVCLVHHDVGAPGQHQVPGEEGGGGGGGGEERKGGASGGLRDLFSRTSMSLPGVATTTSHPSLSLNPCRRRRVRGVRRGRREEEEDEEEGDLLLPAEASYDGHCADPEVFAELVGLLLYLLGELPGGGHDDGVGALVLVLLPRLLGQGQDPHEQRDEEGRRLARARLRHPDQVPVSQPDGDRLGGRWKSRRRRRRRRRCMRRRCTHLSLDGARLLVLDFIDHVQDFLVNVALTPEPDGSGHVPALDGDVVVLPGDGEVGGGGGAGFQIVPDRN